MAEYTLTDSRFPNGTTVYATPLGFGDEPVSGTVASGAVTFSGLRELTRYVARGRVLGVLVESRFSSPSDLAGGGSGTILPFQASHAYRAGEAMTVSGLTWTRNADGTSRATFDATEQAAWTVLPTTAVVTENVNTVSTAGSAQTLPDVTTATLHKLTLTAASCALTFPTAAAGKSFTVVIAQDSTGGRLATWPASVLWPGNIAPTLSTTANAQDVFSFLCADGTTWIAFIPTTNLAPRPYRLAVLADSPLAYWRLGEASGATAADEVAAHPGTYVSATLGAAGALNTESNTAATFNGTTSKVTATGAILAGRAAWTIELWAKITSVGQRVLYGERGSAGNDILKLASVGNSTVQLVFRDHAGVLNTLTSANGNYANGSWHHIAVTKTGTTVTFYSDGVSIGTATLTASDTFGEATISTAIGADPTGVEFIAATIDEVAVYATALSATRIAAHYTAGTVG